MDKPVRCQKNNHVKPWWGSGMSSHLPADSIARNGCKTRIPEPTKHVDSSLHPCVLGLRILGVSLLLRVCHDGVPFLGDSYADEENVTFLECDVGFFCNL